MNNENTKGAKFTTGPIAWMINNRVTPNLLMIMLVLGGLLLSSQIKREVFPPFELGKVTVSVRYPGAGPEEIEQGILLAIEEKLSDIEAIDTLHAIASEGWGKVIADLRERADNREAFQDIEAEVSRITTFPVDAERPVVTLNVRRRQVLRLHLYGDVSQKILRATAETTRDRLLQTEGISQVEIDSPQAHEIEVAIPLSTLRRYNLTYEQVAKAIQTASIELPGGTLKTKKEDVLLRFQDRSRTAEDFSKIPVITSSSGQRVTLGELSEITEGFEDNTRFTTFNGKPSIELLVYRTGKETPITVSDKTRKKIAEIATDFSPAIRWAISRDRSHIYKDRLNLLLKNALIGLSLVLILLGLFLEPKLAFWVTMGIPISFLGAILFLPTLDVSINMVSMFAFIIALGIVVDDAIIVGENVHEFRQRGKNNLHAAILGAREVAIPVTFSILTNILAFLPLAFVPGTLGNFLGVIPLVVIVLFIISWFESLFILPGHLAHMSKKRFNQNKKQLKRLRQRVTAGLNSFIEKLYLPVLSKILSGRYLFVVFMVSVLAITLSYVESGRIRTVFMPRIESDQAVVTATLPWGSPESKLFETQQILLDSLESITSKNGGRRLIESTSTSLVNNEVRIRANLAPRDIRTMTTTELTHQWRKATAPLVGLQSLVFKADFGGPGGDAAITVELSHRNIEVLDAASAALAKELENFDGVRDVDRGYAKGKRQYSYTINAKGQALGLTSTEIGRQLRSAWQGAIALRQQDNGNEVTVRVRLPASERNKEANLENMMIKTPAGVWVPLFEVSSIAKSTSDINITRRDRRRIITLYADVVPISESQVILTSLKEKVLPQLVAQFPGLSWSFQGRQESLRGSSESLAIGFILALAGIYLLLAIPFRSYSQPLIVMAAIPFGIIGAIYGHILMGYNISLMSIMGMVALSGVVVNDSLVLVNYANKIRNNESGRKAICIACSRRFRPVLLTTLTTFGGLAPMIFETSLQARFIIPMAISLGFGIIFATVITLMLIPCLYLIINDIVNHFQKRKENQQEWQNQSEKIEALVSELNRSRNR